MKTIKIKYVDFWPGFSLDEDLIYDLLKTSGRYRIEFSDNPDYIVYSCFGKEHLNYDCVRIFFTGEELCPDFNICDYGIGFEYLEFADRYFRLPLMYIPRYRKDYEAMISRKYTNQNGREFCSFVYSNPTANPIRTEFFSELSKYKKIASGGKILNNVGGPVGDKRKFESQYKFSIAFENVKHSGYTTEKLMQAFAAGGIPIYWGDPLVNRMFNSKAFINVSDFESITEAIDFIRNVDQNEDLYKQILSEPALNENYLLNTISNQFQEFLFNIFDQDLQDAKRTTREMYNKMYVDGVKNKEKIFQMSAPARKVFRCLKKFGKKKKN